ncbi:alpha/beta hydrolase [bacterium]|nr:alpha/beta hydrolase [bacterium]
MQNGSDTNLFYEVHGHQGPYLLLVHGFLSSRRQWMLNLESLSRFCRPVVIELYAHGRSPSPSDGMLYRPENYAREFERIRRELCIEQWFVCGQSLGAALTFRYVLDYPEVVLGHIFTNSMSALTEETFEEKAKLLVELLEAGGQEAILELPVHPSKSSRLNPDVKKTLMDEAKLIDIKGLSLTGLNTLVRASVRSRLGINRTRTLLIAGRFDRAFTPYLEIAEEIIPYLAVEILDGGHGINIDAPNEFNRLVERFLNPQMETGADVSSQDNLE